MMNARVEREISDIIDDLTGFVAEVRRQHGEEEAREFIDQLLKRIGEMWAEGEFERVA
jgi:hypothetical protein